MIKVNEEAQPLEADNVQGIVNVQLRENQTLDVENVQRIITERLRDNQGLDSDQVHRIISNRLRDSRPVAWEEDISRNTLDTQPFNNSPSVGTLDASEFTNPTRLSLIHI